MKTHKITYTIKDKKVFRNVIQADIGAIMNYSIIYTGSSKKECERWLKLYKKHIPELEKKIKDLREELSRAYLDIENLKKDLENQVRSK